MNSEHPDMIAIDFGTSRTKAAYYNSNTDRIDLIKLGQKAPYIPSLFHLSRVNEQDRILLGEAAEIAGMKDPQGLIIGLKTEIHREGQIRKGRLESRPTRKELLAQLFRFIHTHTKHTQQFRDKRPEVCRITVPVKYEEIRREAIREAALLGGFKEVTIIEEPVAAATAWLRGVESSLDTTQGVIVCDVGGGTTDFALLQKTDHGYQVDERVPPDGHEQMGGNYLDAKMVEAAKGAFPELAQGMIFEEVQNAIRNCREVLHLGEKSITLRTLSVEIELPYEFMEKITHEFNQDVMSAFAKFLAKCDEHNIDTSVPVVLIGGGSRIHGLTAFIRENTKRTVYEWEDSDVAVVKGAVHVPDKTSRRNGSTSKIIITTEQIEDFYRDIFAESLDNSYCELMTTEFCDANGLEVEEVQVLCEKIRDEYRVMAERNRQDPKESELYNQIRKAILLWLRQDHGIERHVAGPLVRKMMDGKSGLKNTALEFLLRIEFKAEKTSTSTVAYTIALLYNKGGVPTRASIELNTDVPWDDVPRPIKEKFVKNTNQDLNTLIYSV